MQAELAELLDASVGTAGSRHAVELDQQASGRLSRVDAMQMQAMAVAVEGRRQLRIARLRSALQRLQTGAYGDCAVCGEPIDARRLAFDPSLPTCLGCARRGES